MPVLTKEPAVSHAPPTQRGPSAPPPERGGFSGAVYRALRRKSTWIVGVPLLFVMAVGVGGLAWIQYRNAHTLPPLSFADVPADDSGSRPGGILNLFPLPGRGGDAGLADDGEGAEVPTPSDVAAPGLPRTASSPDDRSSSDPADHTASAPAAPADQPSAAPGQPSAPSPEPAGSELDGTWSVGAGTVAGYRFGYSTAGGRGTQVGRGDAVTGDFQLAGSTVRGGQFSVDFREVRCDGDGGDVCDQQVHQMMDVENHPFETFALTQPIELGHIPADGEQITAKATGQLTLRGVTRTVTFDVTARRNAGRIEVLGSIPVNRDDYAIPDPEAPVFTIDKDGLIEFLLLFDHTP